MYDKETDTMTVYVLDVGYGPISIACNNLTTRPNYYISPRNILVFSFKGFAQPGDKIWFVYNKDKEKVIDVQKDEPSPLKYIGNVVIVKSMELRENLV